MKFAEQISQLFLGRESTVVRDLKLNLARLVGESNLSEEDAVSIVLAIAQLENCAPLKELAIASLRSLNFDDVAISEASESAAIMSMLNMYYRFRHFVKKEEYEKAAGLRMTSLAKPVLGKMRFELLALAVSIVNGCETCVAAHEHALRELGASSDVLHDVARLAAVLKGVAIAMR